MKRPHPALFWTAIVLFAFALVPQFGSAGYVALGGMLGESDRTLEPRLQAALAHQEHPEARREVEQIRRAMRAERIRALLELHSGLACLAHLVGLVVVIVGRYRQPALAIVGAVFLGYALTGALSANLELVHLPSWALRLSWLAAALLVVALGLLLLGRRQAAVP